MTQAIIILGMAMLMACLVVGFCGALLSRLPFYYAGPLIAALAGAQITFLAEHGHWAMVAYAFGFLGLNWVGELAYLAGALASAFVVKLLA